MNDADNEFEAKPEQHPLNDQKPEPENISQRTQLKFSKKSRNWFVLLLILLCVAAGFGGGLAAMEFGQSLLYPTGTIIDVSADSNINTAQVVAEKVMPSVVGISIEIVSQTARGQRLMEGVGTGVIIDKNGYILTNSHVINDGNTKSILVYLYDGRKMTGDVLWHDAAIDLAIVRVKAGDLIPAELGDSEKIKVGQYAVAIGNPLGFAFERSVTAGIISGLNRSIPISNTKTIDGLLQTDASINPGNSGGPLLDAEAKVIGINTAKIQSGEGLGFAIPINIAKPIVEEIKATGQFTRAYMGIQGISVQEVLAMYPNRDLGVTKGIFVYQVSPGSPAEIAGLLQNDIILKIEDLDVATMSELTKVMFNHRPGDSVKVEFMRGKDLHSITIKLTQSSN